MTAVDQDELFERATSGMGRPTAAKGPRREPVRYRTHYASHREAFVESAAMEREMYRL
jgi:hypothetical protein